jgi:hypothetical protein
MRWPLCQEVCFRVVGSTQALHFHQHCSAIGENTRVMPLHVLGVGYCPVRNLYSSASWPTLHGVELSPHFTS